MKDNFPILAKKKYWFIFLAIIIFFMNCHSIENTYLPLNEGIQWEYQVSSSSLFGLDGGGLLRVTNLPQRELKGRQVTPWKIEVGGITYFQFICRDANGYFLFAEQKPGSVDPEIKKFPSYIIKFPVKKGIAWNVQTETTFLVQREVVYLISSIESTDEIVTVSAGTFKRCILIKSSASTMKDLGILGKANIEVESYDWYAMGIGLIKSIHKEKSNHLMAGPGGELTMQLVSVRKGVKNR